MSARRRYWPWLVAVLAVAGIVHIASVFALPRLVMSRAMSGIARAAGGVNRMGHGKRPTAAARGVVRPSPDLLYSTCVYDLSAGPLHVQAHDMPDSYWSVSLFDDATNNYYVLNDRQAKTGGVDFIIVPPDQDKPPPGMVVRAPSRRGLVLFRTLIADEAHVAQIDAARRHAACEPVGHR